MVTIDTTIEANIEMDLLVEKTKKAVKIAKESAQQLAKLKIENTEMAKTINEYQVAGVKVLQVLDEKDVEIQTLTELVNKYEVALGNKDKMIQKFTEILEEYKPRLLELTD
jgi:predicted Zn-dependent protease